MDGSNVRLKGVYAGRAGLKRGSLQLRPFIKHKKSRTPRDPAFLSHEENPQGMESGADAPSFSICSRSNLLTPSSSRVVLAT